MTKCAKPVEQNSADLDGYMISTDESQLWTLCGQCINMNLSSAITALHRQVRDIHSISRGYNNNYTDRLVNIMYVSTNSSRNM